MASLEPNTCCTQGNFHEGESMGHYKNLFGLDTYQIGEENGNDRIIVILTDIFGYKFNNNKLIADELAKVGKYHVLVPDLFNGDAIPPDFKVDFIQWKAAHSPDKVGPLVKNYLDTLCKELSPKFLGGIGHCYGAKYVVKEVSNSGNFDVGAIAHPSHITIEEVNAIEKPILISAAQIDSVFTTDLRHQTEEKLIQKSESEGLRFQIDLFSGVSHGFAVRGDISNPAVKYAKEKVLNDQLVFFGQFS
ncbi:uncharacterized protein PRCAT00000552001 [Priceomyces carsonii]|uniref:uncharacterized protein n=1 Tax=Priceomyces carsonii TaxID=28549 RepID=UPI002EDB5DA8|nr:unnamed protein product [Priceomyces carsonii]